jgi:hypothetical protein
MAYEQVDSAFYTALYIHNIQTALNCFVQKIQISC